MSKSRGNFLDPDDFVAAFGQDGARYVALREVPFDRDAEVSWDSFVRRYNADLANDFGNLVNRTVSMVNRYLDGERPDPVPTADGRLSACLGRRPGPLRRRRGRLPARRGARHADRHLRARRRTRWSTPRARGTWPRPGRPATRRPATQLRGVLGDLVEACRLIGLAVSPFMPATAPRVLAQLGFEYPYAPDGNGGPPILEELAWGRHAGEPGRVTAPEPLFPRLDAEPGPD